MIFYLHLTIPEVLTFSIADVIQERVDRGGGGTGIEGAESGVEGAESGVEGAGSGSRGGGKRGHCGRGSGNIGGRNCFFTRKFIKKKRFITIPFKTYKSYKGLKGRSSLSSLGFE